MAKKNKTKNINIILISLLIVGIIIVYFCIYRLKKDKISNAEKSVEIIQNIQNNEDDEVLKNVQELHNLNNDLVGYIIIPDTKINYPVMYTGDDYYLRKSFQKEYLLDGTLYIDKYNSIDPRDTNIIIYGHNMDNGNMFHDLEKYREKSFYDNHKYFNYYTLTKKETYEIVAVFLSQVYYVTDDVFKYYKFYNASNEEDMNYYYENIKKLSLYDTDTEITYGDYIMTLSTCEYSKKNGRLVVVAKKI